MEKTLAMVTASVIRSNSGAIMSVRGQRATEILDYRQRPESVTQLLRLIEALTPPLPQ
jgi:hypothetical protein